MKTPLAIAALAVIGCSVAVHGEPAAPEWKVGVASTNITPEKPIWLAGYAARKKPSEGVAMDLYAKALAVEDLQGNRAVIVTADILGFTGAISESIADRLRDKHGLRRDQVVFTCSHTHSGPVVRESLKIAYSLDDSQMAAVREYTSFMSDRIVQVVGEALATLAPASLELYYGKAEFGVNRREKKDSGFVIGVNPAGPVNHEVPILRVVGSSGEVRAVLFGYACHNTTLGGDRYLFHGDYAGVAQQELEKKWPGALALFMIGCAADTNPNPRGTIELVEKHGKSLAAAVSAAVSSGKSLPVRAPLGTRFDRVDLPFATPPSREDLQARLSDKDVYVQRHARMLLSTLDEKGKLPASYAYPIGMLQFGRDLNMVFLAGEVVVDYDFRLKRETGLPGKLWVVGYANDVFAYIASRRVLAEGGYEAATSMIYYGMPGPWAPDVEDILVSKVKKLAAR
jgi:hypothetical protein